MKKILLAFCIISSVLRIAHAQSADIIPAPTMVETKEGKFIINASTKILLKSHGLERSSAFFNAYLKKFYGMQLTVVNGGNINGSSIVLKNSQTQGGTHGAYEINMDDINVLSIDGDDEEGVFHGIQTLIQLLPVERSNRLAISRYNILDTPRFAYRGMHLDCGRHFFSVDFIKQYIDFLAMHKMNTFQWHLTEDQGWRIEIKKYPLLTQVGGCRNGTIIGHNPGTANDNTKDCGYYTQSQIKDIVKYAADRYVTIIPEIEMPGHASAAIAAYPQLSCFPDSSTVIKAKVPWAGPMTGKQVQQSWGVFPDVFAPTDYTFNFLQNVLDEVMALFPSHYIHIGGDECPKDYWKKSAFCQQLITQNNLKDEHGLQNYFIGRIEKYLNSKGRSIIGWDEILEGGVAPNATVMSWRGEAGGIEAAKQHHDVIMTPTTYVYFDYTQSKHEDSLTIGGYLPVETIYNYEPIPAQLTPDEAKYVLGGQANVWSEYMSNPAKVEYMIFPRLTALSEVLWSPKENRNWDDFKQRMQTQYKRYDLWGVRYNTKGINKGE